MIVFEGAGRSCSLSSYCKSISIRCFVFSVGVFCLEVPVCVIGEFLFFANHVPENATL
ncbi:hypothetical protein BJX62DRAFT_202359 [Aspergillus germanicus]